MPTEVRDFDSREDYEKFLLLELNAVITQTKSLKRIEVSAIEFERSYFFHPEFGFRPVENAIGTFVGGLNGMIRIAGELEWIVSL